METATEQPLPNMELKMVLSEVIPCMFHDNYDERSAKDKQVLTKLFDRCAEHGVMPQVEMDICTIVRLHTEACSQQLDNLSLMTHDLQRSCLLVQQVHKLMSCFGNAIQYLFDMMRFVEHTKSLEHVLLTTFKTVVMEAHSKDVIEAIKLVRRTPFAVDPSVLHDLVVGIHKMLPQLHTSERELFSYYVPNMKKACTFDGLNEEIYLAKTLRKQLQSSPDFVRSEVSSALKRTMDESQQSHEQEEQSSSTLLANLLLN